MMDAVRIKSTAEPFFFPGDETGCLLIHGLTGTPKEMRWLGEYLAKQGRAVLAIRLAGHATQPEDLLRARWPDWVANVEDGWHLLSGHTKRIFVIGLSMGGILALNFAAQHPVAGVVAMSSAQHLPPDWRLPYIRMFSKIMPGIKKAKSDWHDHEAEQLQASYTVFPTHGLAELRDLLVEMNSALPKVSAPTLLIYSRQDGALRPVEEHANPIYNALGSVQKRVILVDGSGHVITRDAARETVFQHVSAFIDQVSHPSLEIV
jgi:carboxylesterase